MNDTEEEPESLVIVTEAFTEIDPTTIKRSSPKRYIDAAIRGGFAMQSATTKTFEAGSAFKGGDRAGEMRPDKEIEHLWIQGSAPGAAFSLRFDGGSFKDGRVWDIAGWPTELWANYSIGKIEQKRLGIEPHVAEERARRLDAAYNDGEQYVSHRPRLVRSAGDFEEWLSDLVPDFEPRKKAQRKEKTTEGIALINEGVWNG